MKKNNQTIINPGLLENQLLTKSQHPDSTTGHHGNK